MKVFIVTGHTNTGSGTLTYPEDFSVVGVFLTPEQANAHALNLNAGNNTVFDENEGQWIESGDTDEDEDSEYDGTVYEVEEHEVTQ